MERIPEINSLQEVTKAVVEDGSGELGHWAGLKEPPLHEIDLPLRLPQPAMTDPAESLFQIRRTATIPASARPGSCVIFRRRILAKRLAKAIRRC